MAPIVGYLVEGKDGRHGDPGTGYNYVLAGNGLFLETRNGLLDVRISLAEAEVRGLSPLDPYVTLVHGKVPSGLLQTAVNTMWLYPEEELYLAVVWDGQRYALKQPPQERSTARVSYEVVPDTVLSLHSHGRMHAFFSETDDRDETGLILSLVAGQVDQWPIPALLRICAYGFFAPLPFREVISEDGPLPIREHTSV